MPLGRQGPLTKLVGGGIGIAQEYKKDQETRKEAEAASKQKQVYEHDQDSSEDEIDDETWAQDLDAAQLEAVQTNEVPQEDFDEKKWMDKFLRAHPAPPLDRRVEQPLSLPVLIPERRPGFKTRGFVRAYAPVLQDAGIDQDTWIEMLKGFDQSIGNHKWFHVANVAVAIADKIRLALQGVSLIAHAVVLAVHISIEAGRRGYMNVAQNKFLDRLNDEFFKPRGLYAMVIKYNPQSDEPEEDVDVSARINQQVAKRDDDDRSSWKNVFQGSAGKAQHEADIPEFAPLEFPELDRLPAEQKENAVKHFGHFLGEYYDRRGQAKFDAAHPDSKLAGVTGEKEFASRYSDPNHPASTGGLVSTVTGGKVQYTGPVERLTDRRNERRSRRGISRQVGPEARKERKNQRPSRKFLKQDVLYLLVVNMPTEDEIDQALQGLAEAKKQQGQQFDAKAIKQTLGFGSVLDRQRH